VLCEKPDWPKIMLFGSIMMALFPWSLWKLYKNRHVFEGTSAFAHAKIVISFVTVLTTLNTQFGIVWPLSFK
jgi:hypothetical protein